MKFNVKKMKKIDVCFTGILLMLAAVITQAQEAWSFQECLDYAMENNIRIKQQQLSTQYSENLLSQAKHERLPNLNGSLSNNLNFGRSLTYDNTYQNVNSSQVNGYLSTDITLWNGSILSN